MYAKLFASLYQGTLRGQSDEILVFTNLLAHADVDGVVDKHWRAIAEETGLSRERVEAATANLEAPDPESRSSEQDGRRIVRMDPHRGWGWMIVNHGKYKAIKSEEDRRQQNREAQARYREKLVSNSKQASAEVSSDKQDKPIQIYITDVDVPVDTKNSIDCAAGAATLVITPKRGTKKFTSPTIDEVAEYCRVRGNQVDAKRFFNYYESNGWMVGRNKMKDWKASVRTWEANAVGAAPSQAGRQKTAQEARQEVFDVLTGRNRDGNSAIDSFAIED